MNKIKKIEKKQTLVFNRMMDSIACALSSYIFISIGLKVLVHLIEWFISLPFFLNDNYIYLSMDNFADKCGNLFNTIGIIVAVICLINSFFLGRKYFKLDRIIKKHKKRS